MNRKLVIPWVCWALQLLSVAQDMVKLVPDKVNEYALNYYLPYTVADIEFVATKTVCKAGPYYKYAKKYLGVTDIVTEDSET